MNERGWAGGGCSVPAEEIHAKWGMSGEPQQRSSLEAMERGGLAAASVTVGRARRTAERVLRGSLAPTGTPVIFHVRRVAEASPTFARSVAWLDDALEHSSVSEEELLESGLTDEELRALRLLSRDPDSRSVDLYLSHVAFITHASGSAGEIARAVKRADLADRKRHPNRRADGWNPPYQAAIDLLEKVEAESASSPRPRVADSSKCPSERDKNGNSQLEGDQDHALSTHQSPAR